MLLRRPDAVVFLVDREDDRDEARLIEIQYDRFRQSELRRHGESEWNSRVGRCAFDALELFRIGTGRKQFVSQPDHRVEIGRRGQIKGRGGLIVEAFEDRISGVQFGEGIHISP